MISKKITFYGKVQGVGFRFATWRFAQKLQLSGWVRNNDDGTVTLMAQGDEKNIKALIDYLKLIFKGNIEKVEENEEETEKFDTFEIKRD